MAQNARAIAIPANGPRAVLYGPKERNGRLISLALLASFLVPGAGTALTGDLRRGVLFLLAFVAAAFIPMPVFAVAAMFGVWLFSLVDAIDRSLS